MNAPRHPITGCRYQSLLGEWLIEPRAASLLLEQARSWDLLRLTEFNAQVEQREQQQAEADKAAGKPAPAAYDLYDGGKAVIRLSGPTSRYPTTFQRVLGGTSTKMMERALSLAVAAPDVSKILMHYDGVPGGTAAGTGDMVDRIRWAAKQKPLASHVDEQATSAAALFSAQGGRVTAERNAMLGSIGARLQLVDSSGKAAMDGMRFIDVTSSGTGDGPSGRWKAIGSPGSPITADQVAQVQRWVDLTADTMIADIASARRLTPAFLRSLQAGVFGPAEAKALNLIDDICSFEQALADL